MKRTIQQEISTANQASGLFAFHTNDFFEFISQIGFINLDDTKNKLFELNLSWNDSSIAPVLISGKGKIHSIEGDLLAAKDLFEVALRLASTNHFKDATTTNSEIYSYVCYEYALYTQLLFEFDLADEYLQKAQAHAKTPRLSQLIMYQVELLRAKRNKSNGLDKLEAMVKDFEDQGMSIMYTFGLHSLGTLYRVKCKYHLAIKTYRKALEVADRFGYLWIKSLIYNSMAYVYIKTTKFSKALAILERELPLVNSYCIKSIMLENIALIFYMQNDYSKAEIHCMSALETSLQKNVISQALGEIIFLADINEKKFQNINKAKYYLTLGYEQAIFHLEQGLTYSGPRKEVIQMCMEFLLRHFPNTKGAEPPEHLFSFALNKSWVEIKDIFHYNLIMFHKLKTGSGDELYHKMDMKKPTFYSVHRRLANRGFVFPDFRRKDIQFPADHLIETVQSYIKNLPDATWKTANEGFEEDVIRYLYHKYGYQKTKLAEVLKLGYSAVLSKTRKLTTTTDTVPTIDGPEINNSLEHKN